MDNFQAIGQLVTEARNLLDSIKGGAIRAMQTQFDALKQAITNEWNGIKNKVNGDVTAAIARVDTDSVINSMGFTAQNYNADFMDVKSIQNANGVLNDYPAMTGLYGNTNNAVSTELIRVESGGRDIDRPPEISSLLDCMGVIGEEGKISREFNVLKVTVNDATVFGSGLAGIRAPDSRVRRHPASSFMAYYKLQTSETGSVSFLGGDTGGKWKQVVSHFNSVNPEHVIDITFIFRNMNDGDVLYLALPTCVPGYWPQSKKHGRLWNVKNDLIRNINKHH